MDLTFPCRFLLYLSKQYDGSYRFTNSIMEDEYDYMVMSAVLMLKEQVTNCAECDKWYFENIVSGYKDYKDIIEKFICKSNDAFLTYLKTRHII